MKWFRLYTEIRRDPKLRRLPVSHRWVWVTILCMARESPKPGWLLLRKDMPAQPADIADEANVSIDDAARAIELFKSKSYEMLEEKDGTLRVINWAKRQFENDSSTERVRRHRERQNRQQSDGNTRPRYSADSCNVTDDVASNGHGDVACNVTETPLLSPCSSPQENCGKDCRNDGGHNPRDVLLYQTGKPIVNEVLQAPSSTLHHGNSQCNVTRNVTGNVASNAAGNVTLQNYRDTEYNIEIKDISESILSAPSGAEQPKTAPQCPTLSAPDGAVLAPGSSSGTDDSSDQREEKRLARDTPHPDKACSDSHLQKEGSPDYEQSVGNPPATEQCMGSHHLDAPLFDTHFDEPAKGVTSASRNALSSSKLPDQIAIERLSPSHPCSTTHPEPEASKTHFIDRFHPKHPENNPEGDRAGLSALGVLEGEPATDESSTADRSHEAEPALDAASSDAEPPPLFFLTKRRRRLSGWKLETFEEFWRTFAYKKGRAEAADAWLDIPDLTPELARKIVDAADKEAKARPALISKGLSPKWPQGWISARRWEDWEDNPTTIHNQDNAPGREVNDDAKGSQYPREDDDQYRQSIREALKRFM